MNVITISKGSNGSRKVIAAKVNSELCHNCISMIPRLETSKNKNQSRLELVYTINDAHGFLESYSRKKEKHIADLKCTLFNNLNKDKTIYHSTVSHFFVKDAPYALKFEVVVSREERFREVMASMGLNVDEIRCLLGRGGEKMRKWSQYPNRINAADLSLCDLIAYTKKVTLDEAVDIICKHFSKKQFKTTPASQRLIEELALAAALEEILTAAGANIIVGVDNHIGFVEIKVPICVGKKLT